MLTVWSLPQFIFVVCLVIVVLPLTVLTNSHVSATVGVHQMMCEITKRVVYTPSKVESFYSYQ